MITAGIEPATFRFVAQHLMVLTINSDYFSVQHLEIGLRPWPVYSVTKETGNCTEQIPPWESNSSSASY